MAPIMEEHTRFRHWPSASHLTVGVASVDCRPLELVLEPTSVLGWECERLFLVDQVTLLDERPAADRDALPNVHLLIRRG